MGGEILSFGFNIVYQVTDLERRIEAKQASPEEVNALFQTIDQALARDPHSLLLQEQKDRAVSLAGRFNHKEIASQVSSIHDKTQRIAGGHLGLESAKPILDQIDTLTQNHALSLEEQEKISMARINLANSGIESPLVDKSAVSEEEQFGSTLDIEASETLFYMGEMLYTGNIKSFFTSFNALDINHQELFNAHLQRRGVSLTALNTTSIGPAYHNSMMHILQALERTSKHLAMGKDPQVYQSLETIEEIFEEAQAF